MEKSGKKKKKYSMNTEDEADVTQQIWMLGSFTSMQFGMKGTIFPV